jgi:DNA-binding HxlR family transcriptional regulator
MAGPAVSRIKFDEETGMPSSWTFARDGGLSWMAVIVRVKSGPTQDKELKFSMKHVSRSLLTYTLRT